ncbi:hypothetical protein ILUMI_08416 [Ignelater luminosus]|uniref:Sm domain-containing protein n=1 Tax=Ignelater luminosus TaxID=2038154 RepID=A0A8K0D6X7_IGNLU|nr:hypothetical protein ILUMI_08416 [Ignelater luminosus]
MLALRKERFFFFNNLVSVVKGLEGQYTTIDLRNEACLTGKIVNVDGYMNVELEDVILYDPRGSELPFDSFFVSSRLIRYVHIPKGQSAAGIVEKQMQDLPIPRKKKEETFKVRRAKKYHAETVASINKGNDEK